MMTIHKVPQRTPAELALVEAFGERLSQLPGDAEVALKRDQAIERIKSGLPTRRVEAWHYTDLRRLLIRVPPHDSGADARPLAPVVGGSLVLPLLNGVASGSVPPIDGVSVRLVREKLADGTLAAAMLSADEDDVVGALNAAFAADGYFLDIADSVSIDRPIELQNIHAGGQAHVRLPVRVGVGASATVIERHSGSGEALLSSVTNLVVGDNSRLTWLIVQEQPGTATHLGQFNAWIGKNATLLLFVMNAGGKLVRQEVRVAAKGEGGVFTLRSVNLLAGDSHTDLTMVLDHQVPETSSTEVIRNVVTDRAHGVFQGRINVAKYAQKTDAKMACNTLLLSDEADFSTKPELEIFADDVQCGHGATVTEIDRSHLFYLMARGIDEKTARGLLVKAFVAEIIEELEDEAIVAALESRLDAWFAAHG